MIGNWLRSIFTAWWTASASPEPNGSKFIQRTPSVSFGPSTAGALPEKDRKAMQENLTSKYGIKEIDD